MFFSIRVTIREEVEGKSRGESDNNVSLLTKLLQTDQKSESKNNPDISGMHMWINCIEIWSVHWEQVINI